MIFRWPIIATASCMSVTFLMGCGPASEADSQPETELTAPNYRERLGKLKFQRDKLKLSIDRLENERAQIIARLRSKGVESTRDLKSHPNWTIHARELREVIRNIDRLQQTVDSFDAAIVRVESILRRADRERRLQRSDLTENELNELSRTFYEVDEQLKSQNDIPGVEEIELESLLENELKRD